MSVDYTKRNSDLAHEIKTGPFVVNVDVPESLGGHGTAPDPHQYLEVALAGCTALTVQMYANRKQWPLENCDVKIKIVSEGAENVISREICLIGSELTAEQKERLMDIANKCPIHRFLERGAKIESKEFTV